MTTRVCPVCGEEFEPSGLMSKGRFVYCSRACQIEANRDLYFRPVRPARTHKMTDEEFEVYYEAERQRLIAAGRPLVNRAWKDTAALIRKDER